MADMKIQELVDGWVGFEFDVTDFAVEEKNALEWSTACGETDPRFTDPQNPDFQAPPSFTTQFVGGQVFPKGFPRIGQGMGFDGGKCVTAHAPVRPGDVLTAKSSIAEIYEKTGRSGGMVFVVHRMRFSNQDGDLVSTVDWRLIHQRGA